MRFIDLTGRRYGKLLVISKEGLNKQGNRITWNCKCDCGKDCIVTGIYLGRRTNSCGCMSSRNTASERNSTHKMTGSPIYIKWSSMIARCYYSKADSYKDYGGRGITVCDKWLKFEGFYEDMYEEYADKLSIERIDVNGNYCKENCKWIPLIDQAKNKRTTRRFEEFPNKTLKELCKEYGVIYGTVINRLNVCNMNIIQALTKPIHCYERR